ncbi:MAG: 1,4-dihydroxy-6-naphthoate synthase [Bacteroidota bacterium]
MPNNHHTFSLGFSPCPNDCFVFDALLHEKIDTEGLSFIPVIEDVESLNKRAFQKSLDITKLSFFALAHVLENYSLLEAGNALGFGCGPLVVSNFKFQTSNLNNTKLSIAIPGKYTTANFLFSLVYPHLKNKTEILFSEIEDAVWKGKFDLGVIIHESRFTYEKKGLKKIIDLGEWWEKETALPIPLGGIAIKRNLPDELKQKINRVIRKSVSYAFANPFSSKNFIIKHSTELADEVIDAHIKLYVNEYSLALDETGKKAVEMFILKAVSLLELLSFTKAVLPTKKKN